MDFLDAVVVGGGPAGMAAALTLHGLGARVAVLEKPMARRFETLPSRARIVLERLGAAQVLQGQAEVHGARSTWGDAALRERSSLLDPYGPGWNVDRERFDRDLADWAARCGVERRSAALRRARRCPGGWALAAGDARQEMGALFVIDASGRAGAFCRSQHTGCVPVDETVALTSTVDGRPPGSDTFTVVRAVEGGWWYLARITAGSTFAMLATDVSLVPRGAAARQQFFTEGLRNVWPGAAPGPVRLTPAWPQVRSACAGEGWLAVGDAAAALDPLSSSGVIRALESGRDGGEAAARWLAGDRGAPAAFARRTREAFAEHLAVRRTYYGMERRFPQDRFWARRAAT